MILEKIDSLITSWVRSYRTSVRALSLYRLLFASYAILFGLKRFAWVADYPGGLWRPPFPFSLLDTYGTFSVGLYSAPMPEHILIFLEAGLCLLFVLLLFGVWTPYTSISITALLVLLNWQVYSLPKTNHDILFCVTPLVMAFSGWGRAFSIDAQRKTRKKVYPSLSLFLLALVITTGFAVAGLPKLMHWVDFDLSTSGVRMWVTGVYFSGGGGPLSAWMAHVTVPLFWEVLDVVAVIFEIGFLVAVFQRRLFRSWVGLAVGFHFTNYLILGIPFFFNLPVYAAFVPWRRLVDPFENIVQRWKNHTSTTKTNEPTFLFFSLSSSLRRYCTSAVRVLGYTARDGCR